MGSPQPVERRAHGRLYALFSGRGGVIRRKGPYAHLRFRGTSVRASTEGEIAHHAGLEWHADGESFSRLDVEGRVLLRFINARASESLGPVEHFSVVDGVAFCDGEVCAYLDPSRDLWVLQGDGRSWPVLLVQSAAPRPARAAGRLPDRGTRRSRTHR